MSEKKPKDPNAPVTRFRHFVRLDYTVRAGKDQSRSLSALAEGRIIGLRCATCTKVYVPPRGVCPSCFCSLDEEVEVKDSGCITSFCTVNVPYEGQEIKLPYIYACILLDGADIPTYGLIQGIEADEVRMGMRVKAEWKPKEQWGPTFESISCFRPTGEPDAPFESYKEHL